MKVIIISGPTATGKTGLSIDLAKKYNGEIVNFDSLLLYNEITIGTAKPTKDEQGDIPHHMIDVSSISSPLNAADFARKALPIIEEIHKRRKVVFLVGGSGFYLQALLKGMYDSPTTPVEIMERSEELYKEKGIDAFIEILKMHDPLSFSRYHANDHYRVRRAVEHFWTTGIPLSKERERKDQENENLNESSVHGWEVLHLYLDIPRDDHLKLIMARTEKMLELGLIEEVQTLLAQGFTGLEKPLQSIGYKEVIDLHYGVHKTHDECKERIIISTRQLAKSQRTWFNRIKDKFNFNPLNSREEIYQLVKKFIET
jgi:tRNA dimethylallyltransferase